MSSSLWDGLQATFAPGGVRAAVQPIVRASDLEVVGYEVLARMTPLPVQGPSWWLERATELDLRETLELICLERAAELGSPPEHELLFVNVSPTTVGSPDLEEILDRLPGRLVLEVSECEEVVDYQRFRHQLAPLLGRGIRLAIDDAGAGYSSLRHVIELAPDFLKLDREIVRGLDEDPVRLALVRAMVAFAAEVGTHVIGEGVETRAEFEALRDAGVHFVQGYLTGAPTFSWTPSPSFGPPPLSARNDHHLRSLVDRLAACSDARSACVAVVDHLARREGLMPSVYLARGDSLRCMAQRGLWQVLDGMAQDAGITGRAWATASPIVVEDVRVHADYLEAIPGVVSEACVPVLAGERAIGALNVESFSTMPVGIVGTLKRCARALSDRLEQLHYKTQEEPSYAAATASVAISGLVPGPGAARQALECLLRAAGTDSGAIVLEDAQSPVVIASRGPLAATLGELARDELHALAASVRRIRSCYSAGDPSGRCFLGTDSLRDAGARAVLVLPLWVQRRRIGTVVLAHSRPMTLDGPRVGPLEILANHVAAVLVLNLRQFEQTSRSRTHTV